MTRHILAACAAVLLAACAAGNAADETADTTAIALDSGLGAHGRPITTASPRAQSFFDQGLRLEYAFNHEQARRSYAEALRADSACAMCWWGTALAVGPNINAPMSPDGLEIALRAVDQAQRLAGGATPVERDLIDALAARYRRVPPAERPPLDSAYARAMELVAQRYPDDADVLTLYGAALMNLSPWNYWEGPYRQRTPRPGTQRILETLGRAVERDPKNPGACHYYIHAVEAAEPKRALPCAERLADLMPGAGHIVHMPGHIYIRVGRYADAVRINRHAAHADESRIGDQSGLGIYAGAYYPHNYHFMAFAAAMAGMEGAAMEASRTVAPKVPFAVARDVFWIQNAVVLPQLTMLTFGRWDDILGEPLPSEELTDASTLARFARGVAHAARGEMDQAAAILTELERRAAATGGEPAAKPIPHIAAKMLAGEIALRQRDAAGAVRHFQAAAAIEDLLPYEEPPLWYAPVRHSLGRALIEAGRHADAERAYREDLDRFPENGWSLFGLARSLELQGKKDEANVVWRRYRDAWTAADVVLTSSRF